MVDPTASAGSDAPADDATGDRVNFDEFRIPSESETLWTMRRTFLERHWATTTRGGGLTRDRLLSLSMVYANMEAFDCRYPEPVAARARAMAEGIVKRHVQSTPRPVAGGRPATPSGPTGTPVKESGSGAESPSTPGGGRIPLPTALFASPKATSTPQKNSQQSTPGGSDQWCTPPGASSGFCTPTSASAASPQPPNRLMPPPKTLFSPGLRTTTPNRRAQGYYNPSMMEDPWKDLV